MVIQTHHSSTGGPEMPLSTHADVLAERSGGLRGERTADLRGAGVRRPAPRLRRERGAHRTAGGFGGLEGRVARRQGGRHGSRRDGLPRHIDLDDLQRMSRHRLRQQLWIADRGQQQRRAGAPGRQHGTSASTPTAGQQTPYDIDDTLVGSSTSPASRSMPSSSRARRPELRSLASRVTDLHGRANGASTSVGPGTGGNSLTNNPGYTGDSYCSAAQLAGAWVRLALTRTAATTRDPTTPTPTSAPTRRRGTSTSPGACSRVVDLLRPRGLPGLRPGQRPVRLLDGGIRRRHLRLDAPSSGRWAASPWTSRRRHHGRPQHRWLLGGGVRRRPLRLQRALLRIDGGKSLNAPVVGMVATPTARATGRWRPTAVSSTSGTPRCTAPWGANT